MALRSIYRCLLLLLLLHVWPAAVRAGAIALRPSLCAASSPAGPALPTEHIAGLRFVCGRAPLRPDYHDRWLWLRVDPSALRSLPPGWQLRIDQARFDHIAVIAVARDGHAQRIVLGAHNLAENWSPGGLLRFDVDRPGSDLGELYIGFFRLDDLDLLRKVTAASPAHAARADAGWLLLGGLFIGALLSAFAYSLLIYAGQRCAFQRWYLMWVATALAYGLTWTNTIAFLLPGFVGPPAVRVDCVLVGLMIGAGNMFLLAVLEEGMVPRRLRRIGQALAIAGVLVGILASADFLLPAIQTDRWVGYVIMASALSVFASVCIAIRRGSRAAWFYLFGWTPSICAFLLRIARNLGLSAQSDPVDMATFAAIAIESVVFCLAIADRFRLLRRERDRAELARDVMAMESDMLRRAAHSDFLTGLGNRAAFQAALQALADRNGGFTLFLIDVDQLKTINDRLGHDGGDALLAHVGKRLAAVAGPKARVARIGGDEFAILTPAATPAAEAHIEAALDGLQDEQRSHAGGNWSISLSIGSARFPDNAADAESLYKNADLALYHAKRLGRRRRCRYEPSLRAKMDQKATFIRDAYAGLERDEFTIHFQPIIDLASERLIGHEALLRWQHPTLGMLTPGTFGDILTESQIGALLQERVVALTLDALRGQRAEAPFMSMNFTALQLNGVPAARCLLDQLDRAGIAPKTLCIELTEGIVLEPAAEDILSALRLLHEAGVRIALDDFGTGYSSLTHIKQMPIDILKIDRSFVLGLFKDGGASEEILRAIIGLGSGLGKVVIAEGIETEAQRLRLGELGCKFGQGYLFARPGPFRLEPKDIRPRGMPELRLA